MKKTAFTLLLAFLALAWCRGDDNDAPRQRINWNTDTTLLSHPYYITATLQQSSIGQNLRFDFMAEKSQQTWTMVLIKIDSPLERTWVAVQISLRAKLPAGLRLSCALEEDDEVTYESQWEAESSDNFTTVTLPLSKFAISPWCRKKDKDAKLDLDQVKTILIGAIGDWSGSGDRNGEIEVKDIILLRELPAPR